METIKHFLNEDGIVKSWPSKRSKKEKVLEYLAAKFEKDKIYTEKEINEILNQWHTFNDSPLLRRELYEYKFLDRERDCSKYWVRSEVRNQRWLIIPTGYNTHNRRFQPVEAPLDTRIKSEYDNIRRSLRASVAL